MSVSPSPADTAINPTSFAGSCFFSSSACCFASFSASLISYVPEKSLEENTAEMEEAIARVKTGQITYAVRDTRIEENEIHEDDIMGIGDKGILAVGGIKKRLQRIR